MKRIKLIAGIVLLLALLPAGFASASPPINATGTCTLTGVTGFHAYPQGQHCIRVLEGIHVYAGTIEATCETSLRMTVYGPCTAGAGELRANWLGYSVCEGTVDDREGTFEIQWTAQVDPDADPNTKGTMLLSGTGGDLADLHGLLKFAGRAGQAGVYEGFVHVDPE
ncbi:MAG: DUF3224 domain-containing protein [Anaerolineae bacterium]|nr:DUF3224 domain-containing protein [Anaerolineae bacterium]